MKRVAILGSTGSIGRQTLEVAKFLPDDIRVVALAAGRDGLALAQQAQEFGVTKTALFDSEQASIYGHQGGIEAITRLATDDEVDLVVVSVAGVIGLKPTVAAIEAGKNIALASKEVLVAAGELVMPIVQKHGTVLTPIDSEHSAIFQCLQGYLPSQVDSLILTASGGPFRGQTKDSLESVTREQALKHPTWTMGGKITIDSASLMNKALEVIEAKWLFGIDMDKIEAVIHPQSVIHSMVRFTDQSVIGQLGWPDMRLPIQYALMYPERLPNPLPKWNPTETPSLTFEEVNETVFPAFALARHAVKVGGTMPCVFNAANEEAVALFLEDKIRFLDIYRSVEHAMQVHSPSEVTLNNLVLSDSVARETVRNRISL